MSQMFVYIAILMMLALFVIIVIRISKGIISFHRNLKYLNSEIKRTTGSEQRAWMKKKRRIMRRFYLFFFD